MEDCSDQTDEMGCGMSYVVRVECKIIEKYHFVHCSTF